MFSLCPNLSRSAAMFLLKLEVVCDAIQCNEITKNDDAVYCVCNSLQCILTVKKK
jgi:hypothetical protein